MNNKTKKLDDFINNLEPVNEVKPEEDDRDVIDMFSDDVIKELGITDYKDKLFAKDMIARGFFLGLDIGENMPDDLDDVCNDCKNGSCGNNSDDNE